MSICPIAAFLQLRLPTACFSILDDAKETLRLAVVIFLIALFAHGLGDHGELSAFNGDKTGGRARRWHLQSRRLAIFEVLRQPV